VKIKRCVGVARLAIFALITNLAFQPESKSATISGAINNGAGDPVRGVIVTLFVLNPENNIWQWSQNQQSDLVNPGYRFDNLAAGAYTVCCQDYTGKYAFEYFGGQHLQNSATIITLATSGSIVSDAHFQLQEGADISGVVQGKIGSNPPQPLADVIATINEVVGPGGETKYVTGIPTFPDGTFKIGLPPGIYVVHFIESGTDCFWATQTFEKAIGIRKATPIVLGSINDSRPDINAVMIPGFIVSGKVTYPNGIPAAAIGVSFTVYDETQPADSQWVEFFGGFTDSGGNYALSLPPSRYRLEFYGAASFLYEREVWDDSHPPSCTEGRADFIAPTDIVITNASRTNIDAQFDYSPLALWAFNHGINPFANVAGWLEEDADRDGFDNFHEFAFGTDPTNSANGNSITITSAINGDVKLSAVIRSDESSGYWLDYRLKQSTELAIGDWVESTLTATPSTNTFELPTGYVRLDIDVPNSSYPKLFFRASCSINP